jgi:hypothetical protein
MRFTDTQTRLFFAISACICITLFVGIGLHPDAWPAAILNRYFAKWNSNGLQIETAWIFTSSGFLPQLGALAVVALIGGLLKRTWLSRVIFSIVLDVVACAISECYCLAIEPSAPAVAHLNLEYVSGDAVHAVLVYGLWSLYFLRSSVSAVLRFSFSAFIGLWMLGLSWSPLALGVHDTTDIIGGWFLALGMLSVGFAIYPRVLRTV